MLFVAVSVAPGLERVDEGEKYPPNNLCVPPVEAAVEAIGEAMPYMLLVPVVIAPVIEPQACKLVNVSAVVEED